MTQKKMLLLNLWLYSIAVEQLELEPTDGVQTFTFVGWYLKINGLGHGEAKRSPSFLIMNYMVQLFFNILWYLRVVFFLVYKTPEFFFLTTAQHAF